jgi:hypothetical protein
MATKKATAPMVQKYKTPNSRITTALVNTDLNVDATNAVEIFTAGTADAKIGTIELMSQAVSVVGRVILYHFNGTTYQPLRDALVQAFTPSSTVLAWSYTFIMNDMPLEAGHKLFIGVTAISSPIGVVVTAGNYEEE